MVPESRRIARLLLTHPTAEQWDEAMKQENLLQKKPATARRQARLIRNRLATLDDEGLQLVADGEGELTGQLLLAASARHSQLLSDFMRDVYAADLRRLERTLSHRQWEAFLTEYVHRDDAVGAWPVVDYDRLPQPHGQPRRELAQHHVARAAGGLRRDDADRAAPASACTRVRRCMSVSCGPGLVWAQCRLCRADGPSSFTTMDPTVRQAAQSRTPHFGHRRDNPCASPTSES